jgi:hypothetical protein
MAWPGEKFAVIHGVQLPAHRLGGDVNAELLKDPLAQIDEPPAHDAMDGRDWPILDHPRERRPVFVLSLDGWPSALRLRDPSGPWALNFKTQSRTICNVTPPIFAASVRVAPLIDRSQGEKPPRLWPILCLFRYRARTRRIKITPKPNRSRHGDLPPFASLNHISDALRIPKSHLLRELVFGIKGDRSADADLSVNTAPIIAIPSAQDRRSMRVAGTRSR